MQHSAYTFREPVAMPTPAAAETARDSTVVALRAAYREAVSAVLVNHTAERILAAAEPYPDEAEVSARLGRLARMAEALYTMGEILAAHDER